MFIVFFKKKNHIDGTWEDLTQTQTAWTPFGGACGGSNAPPHPPRNVFFLIY